MRRLAIGALVSVLLLAGCTAARPDSNGGAPEERAALNGLDTRELAVAVPAESPAPEVVARLAAIEERVNGIGTRNPDEVPLSAAEAIARLAAEQGALRADLAALGARIDALGAAPAAAPVPGAAAGLEERVASLEQSFAELRERSARVAEQIAAAREGRERGPAGWAGRQIPEGLDLTDEQTRAVEEANRAAMEAIRAIREEGLGQDEARARMTAINEERRQKLLGILGEEKFGIYRERVQADEGRWRGWQRGEGRGGPEGPPENPPPPLN